MHLPTLKTYVLILMVVAKTFISIPANAQGWYHGASGEELKQRLTTVDSDTGRIHLLLALSLWHKNKQGELMPDLDSAITTANEAVLLSRQIEYNNGEADSYLALSGTYKEKGDRQKYITFFNRAVSIAEKNKFYQTLGNACTMLALDAGIENEEAVVKRIKYFEKATFYFEKAGNLELQARAFQDLGESYLINSDYTKSIKALERSISLYDQANFKDQQGTYLLLGAVYNQTGQYDKALKYGFQAEQIAREVSDTSLQLCSIYTHLGRTHSIMKIFDEAAKYYQKALDIAIKYKDTTYIETLTQNVISMLIRLNKPKEALTLLLQTARDYPAKSFQRDINLTQMFTATYTMLGKFEQAKSYYTKLNTFRSKLDKNDPIFHLIYRESINYLQATGQYNLTYKDLDEYSAYCKRRGNMLNMSTCELLYFKTDSALGRLVPAIRHYQLYKSLNDSIYNAEKSNQISRLQVESETSKKDYDILVLKKQSDSQYSNLQKQKIVRNAISAGAALLILLLALVYSRYRIKQRNELVMESKQKEINDQNKALKKLLGEKEWLLKEIHHRVKNNLQIVISLLNTQSAYLNSEEAIEAIQNSQHRMHAMSLIHQKLYQSDNVTTIDMNWYIHELVGYIRDCFDETRKLSFDVHIDRILLDVVQAIPLSLILNESITNAIKYAFPEEKKGEIKISMRWMDTDTCQLIVADNGVGLPPGFDIQQSFSLGMSLMYGLSEQIGGALSIQTENGTRLSIFFRVNMELENAQAA